MVGTRLIVLSFFAAFACSSAAYVSKERTITKVVNLLKEMLDKSKKEGDEERTIYGKFKCYCDNSEAEKKATVKELTEQIALLESQIEQVQGSTGELSSQCADLKTKIADNQQAQDDATALRNKENKAFLTTESDLEQAIEQMKEAIEVLGTVGADQTAGSGDDHKKFMAGKAASMMSLQAQVQNALKAAVLLSPKQRAPFMALLQAPFTGSYTSQSGNVMGILKNMRDTFKTNLDDARTTEKTSQASFDKFMKIKKSEAKTLNESYDDKQKELADNDGELSTKKSQFTESKKQLASAQEFLGKLLPMCEEKAKGFENRNMLRANEEAAIAEAISILNSDDAFSTFGSVDATHSGKTAAFIQLRSVHKHMSAETQLRHVTEKMLQEVAQDTKSARVSKIVELLKAGNPFDTVMKEIEKMIELSAEEGKADKKKLDWCNTERDENEESLKQKKTEILGLNQAIDKLTGTIEHPKTGLKAMIQETETSLTENAASQKSETQDRTEENVAYQANIKNIVQAEDILTKAIGVLKKYYEDLEKKLEAGEALVQKGAHGQAPEAWKGDGEYKGQSSKGNDIIQMLEFIHDESVKEEHAAHADEEKAQADYEDSMADLKKQEADAQRTIADFQESLAVKEKELLEAQEDLKSTTKDKEAVEAYLEKIKPGCDFITTNFDLREKNRATETAALSKAIKLIQGTPAYKAAESAATVESYGECKEPCVADAAHVKCKACMAKVTIPAYCAGHEGTAGC